MKGWSARDNLGRAKSAGNIKYFLLERTYGTLRSFWFYQLS